MLSRNSNDRFKVLRPHAEGGLGEVSIAQDLELNREVALKAIRGRYADDAASRTRFHLEAEVTGQLEHPGIVPVYGLGSMASGSPFYVMRFIHGGSLQEAVKDFHNKNSPQMSAASRRLKLRSLIRRLIDVCNAIEYAHSRGVRGCPLNS